MPSKALIAFSLAPNISGYTSQQSRALFERLEVELAAQPGVTDVTAALDIARNIFEVCAGSYADGFIFNYMREKVGLDDESAAQIIQDFRGYRADLVGEFKADQG